LIFNIIFIFNIVFISKSAETKGGGGALNRRSG